MEYLVALIMNFGAHIKLFNTNLYELGIFILIFYSLFISRKITLKKNDIIIILFVSLVIIFKIFTLAFGLNVEKSQFLSIGYEVIFLFFFLFILLNNINYKKVWEVNFIIVLIQSFIGIMQFIFSMGREKGTGLTGGIHWIIIPFIIFFIISKDHKKYKRIIIVLFLSLALITTQQRIGLVTLLVGLGISFIFFKDTRKKIILWTIGYITLFIILWFIFIPQEIKNQLLLKVTEIIKIEGTIRYREIMWYSALLAFLKFPFFGIGSGGFSRNLSDLIITKNGYLYNYIVQNNWSTHNTFLENLVETGLIGTFVYYNSIIFILLYSKKIIKPFKNDLILNVLYIMLVTYSLLDLYGQGTFTFKYTNTFVLLYSGYKYKLNKG